MFKIGLKVFLMTFIVLNIFQLCMKKSWFYCNNNCIFSTYQQVLIYTYPDKYHNFQKKFMKIHEDNRNLNFIFNVFFSIMFAFFLKNYLEHANLELNFCWKSFVLYKGIWKWLHQQRWQAGNSVTFSKFCIASNWKKISLYNYKMYAVRYTTVSTHNFERNSIF